MKTPGMYYYILAAICILIVCVGMVSAAHTIRPASNSMNNKSFIQSGCNMTGPQSMDPILSHKTHPAMNRTGPNPVMNKTCRGNNAAVRTMQEGMCPHAGNCRITNASAHTPASAVTLCVQNGGNVTGIKKDLMAGNLTRSRYSGCGQTLVKNQ